MLNIVIFEGLSHTGKSTFLKVYRNHLDSLSKPHYTLSVSNDSDQETTDYFRSSIMEKERRVEIHKINKLLRHKAETRNALQEAATLTKEFSNNKAIFTYTNQDYQWIDKEYLTQYLNIAYSILLGKYNQFTQMIKLITRFGEEDATLLLDRYIPSTLVYLPLDFNKATLYAVSTGDLSLMVLANKVLRTYCNCLEQLKYFHEHEFTNLSFVYTTATLENRRMYSGHVSYNGLDDETFDRESLDIGNDHVMSNRYKAFFKELDCPVYTIENNGSLEESQEKVIEVLDKQLGLA